MYGCFACTSTYVHHMHIAIQEARKGHMILWNCRYRWRWTSIWVLEVELWSSGRAGRVELWLVSLPMPLSRPCFLFPARHHNLEMNAHYIKATMATTLLVHFLWLPPTQHMCVREATLSILLCVSAYLHKWSHMPLLEASKAFSVLLENERHQDHGIMNTD